LQIGMAEFDPQFIARPINRVIQNEILNRLSKEILSGTITGNKEFLIDCQDQKLVFKNK
jgi:ATP-dependent Clp protease ATP-binding subunit ClpB